jgi:PAS domain S-box-containing protein
MQNEITGSQNLDALSPENMFRSLVENSHAGIFLIDTGFHLTYANSRLAEILGYTVPDIVGSDFRRFLDEDSKRLVADRYIRRQEESCLRATSSISSKNGQKRCAAWPAVYRDAGRRYIQSAKCWMSRAQDSRRRIEAMLSAIRVNSARRASTGE